MSLELRDLRWAIIIAQHRSLRQAAAALNIRQSTLSRSLSELEHVLGAALFERTNGGTHPKPEGREFLEAARMIIQETEAIADRLKTRSRGDVGQLTIGIHAALSAGNLRATLVDHRRRFPAVETRLIDGAGDKLVSDLASGVVDVAFVAGSAHRWGDKSLAVWSERVVLALPEGHPLCSQQIVQWDDLQQENMLMPMRGPGQEFLHLIADKLGDGVHRRVTRHDASLDRLLTLVGAEWGVLLALEGATGLMHPGVVFREVHDFDGPTRVEFWACWRNANSNPSLRPFLEMLRERYPDISGGGVIG